jgi:hypothetical protein
MMTSITDTLKQALDALEGADQIDCDMQAAITAIKEVLAQPKQEPFAYVNVENRRLEFATDYVKWDTPTTIKLDKIPLYTHPPQRTWQGLTADEIWNEWLEQSKPERNTHNFVVAFTRAIEAKLKEKNS